MSCLHVFTCYCCTDWRVANFISLYISTMIINGGRAPANPRLFEKLSEGFLQNPFGTFANSLMGKLIMTKCPNTLAFPAPSALSVIPVTSGSPSPPFVDASDGLKKDSFLMFYSLIYVHFLCLVLNNNVLSSYFTCYCCTD